MRTALLVLLAHLLWFIPAWAQTETLRASASPKPLPQDSLEAPGFSGTDLRPEGMRWSPASLPGFPKSAMTPRLVRGYSDGRAAAIEYHQADGWTTGGVACGLCFSLLGTVVITAASTAGNVQPPPLALLQVSGQDQEYQIGYFNGYSEEARSANSNNALVGGLVGTAIGLGVYLLIANNSMLNHVHLSKNDPG
jgi:hypothetical protein